MLRRRLETDDEADEVDLAIVTAEHLLDLDNDRTAEAVIAVASAQDHISECETSHVRVSLPLVRFCWVRRGRWRGRPR